MIPQQGQLPNVPIVPPGPPPGPAAMQGAQAEQLGAEQALAQAVGPVGPSQTEGLSPEDQQIVASVLSRPELLTAIVQGATALMAEAEAAAGAQGAQAPVAAIQGMGAPAPQMNPAAANAMLFGGGGGGGPIG